MFMTYGQAQAGTEEWWPGLQPKPVLNVPCLKTEGCFQKIVGFPPKSSILIGISIIFTIHFGVSLIFGNTQKFD